MATVERVARADGPTAWRRRRTGVAVPAAYLVATLGAGALAAVMLPLPRPTSRTRSRRSLFLVPVVAASWLGGVWPGRRRRRSCPRRCSTSAFLPPYGTFDLERTEYLGAFLGFLATVAADLVARGRGARARDGGRGPRGRGAAAVRPQPRPGVRARRGAGAGARPVPPSGWGSSWRSVRDEDPAATRRARLPVAGRRGVVGSLVFVGDRAAADDGGDPGGAHLRRRGRAGGRGRSGSQPSSERRRCTGATEDMRRSLLAAASHELKSPVAAITASVTDVLGRDRLDLDVVREVLEDVRASTSRLEQLITNLLDMSRIESGTLVAARRDGVPRRPARPGGGRRPRALAGRRHRRRHRRRTRAASAATRCSSSGSSPTSWRTPRAPCAAPPTVGSSFAARARRTTVVLRVIDHGPGLELRRSRAAVHAVLPAAGGVAPARGGSRTRDLQGVRDRDGRRDLGDGHAGRRRDVRRADPGGAVSGPVGAGGRRRAPDPARGRAHAVGARLRRAHGERRARGRRRRGRATSPTSSCSISTCRTWTG